MEDTHKLLYLDPFWTIQNNFTYDPVTNQTLLSVCNPSYLEQGATLDDDGPYPTVGLIGPSAVPEPGSLALVGFGVVAVWLSRARSAQALRG